MTVMRTMALYRSHSRATIFLEGEIDLDSAPLLHAAVHDCVSRGASSVDIDLARLTFCDASGLNAFIGVTLFMGAIGGGLRLRHASPPVRRTFDLTGTVFLLDAPAAARVPLAVRRPPVPSGERPAATGDQ